MLEIRPITLKAANAYVAQFHRHNLPTNGHKFSVACYDGDRLCGVAIAGRPVARKLDDGLTIEICRVCTDGTRNACSILYGACSRCAREMGYKRVVTYTLVSESGSSLKAAGFQTVDYPGVVRGMFHPGRERIHKKVNRNPCLGRRGSIRRRRRSGGRNITSRRRTEIEGLKPCPFCGSKAKTQDVFVYEDLFYKVKCNVCGGNTRIYRDIDDAVSAWNMRSQQSEESGSH